MENPIKIHDLGVPLFLETPILSPKNFVRYLKWRYERTLFSAILGVGEIPYP